MMYKLKTKQKKKKPSSEDKGFYWFSNCYAYATLKLEIAPRTKYSGLLTNKS